MICKLKKDAKKKEPIGSLFEDSFRPLGLDNFADYPAILITFNGLIARAGVKRFEPGLTVFTNKFFKSDL